MNHIVQLPWLNHGRLYDTESTILNSRLPYWHGDWIGHTWEETPLSSLSGILIRVLSLDWKTRKYPEEKCGGRDGKAKDELDGDGEKRSRLRDVARCVVGGGSERRRASVEVLIPIVWLLGDMLHNQLYNVRMLQTCGRMRFVASTNKYTESTTKRTNGLWTLPKKVKTIHHTTYKILLLALDFLIIGNSICNFVAYMYMFYDFVFVLYCSC